MEKGALGKKGWREGLEDTLQREQGEMGLVKREPWRRVKEKTYAQGAPSVDAEQAFPLESRR